MLSDIQKNEGQKVLIIDDVEENRIIAEEFVKRMGHETHLAENGLLGLAKVKLIKPDLILLDLQMPHMDGFEVLEKLQSEGQHQDIPVIIISAYDDMNQIVRCIEYGAVDYLIKPIKLQLLQARVKTVLAQKRLKDQVTLYQEKLEVYNISLEEKVQQRTKALHETQLDVVYRLGRAAEFRDNETGLHVIRMSLSCERLAKELRLDEKECERIRYASPMHDIGKIGIPDNVLIKPGKLDHNEWAIMKTHSEIGAKILSGSNSSLLAMAEMIAITHHEKWDGSGYPKGLKGNEIPLIGRIVALCDVFDALVSERPYKKRWSVKDATDLIEKEAGAHFDPDLVPKFLKILPDLLAIQENYKENKT